MLKDIRSISIHGGNFETPTKLSLLCDSNNPSKTVLLYGRNGSGKSTIARSFWNVKGRTEDNIISVSLQNDQGASITLTEEEKEHIFIFDERYVIENVRVQEDGLGSIVMLGEQVGLAELIEKTTDELKTAKKERDQKNAIFSEYNDSSNPKAPRYYINKIYSVLQQDNGWAGRKRKIDQLKRNASVNDNTYKDFIALSPQRTRDELIIDFDAEWKHLEDAQSGIALISAPLPTVPMEYISFDAEEANGLLKCSIERPVLSEREQYLLELVQKGNGEELRCTAHEFESEKLTICPKCHQTLSDEYKTNLIGSIKKVLSKDVEDHQKCLNNLILKEYTIDLEPFKELSSYHDCIEKINDFNELIRYNNNLLQSKIDNPYTPVTDGIFSLKESVSALESCLRQIENERTNHNRDVADTKPIKEALTRINNEIAYWDIIDYSRQFDAKQRERTIAENELKNAQELCDRKQTSLNELNAQQESINIAIDVINDGLKYIFFSNERLQISIEGNKYGLTCNGHPVKPKDVSVGERNIIGLCYFFASILKGKSRDNAYLEEYLLIIDDPVSSFDLENRVGILSYLKYELGMFLLGNPDSRALVMTHDLYTAIDVGKMSQELINECNKKYSGHGPFLFSPKELRDNQIVRFANKRNEYTTLLELVYAYANGEKNEQSPYIGNIIRQVLEAFSTFEYKKGIEEVSVDDEILALMKNDKYKSYFKNLMYRLVLNEGSHRYDQTRNMQIDFFSLISEAEKRRTAKDILCFMELLNSPHIKSHLGNDATRTIDTWCEEIISSETKT